MARANNPDASFQGRQAKNKTMSRREALKRIVKGAGTAAGATGIGAIGINAARAIKARQEKGSSERAFRATQYRAAKIPNPQKWAQLSEIYKLDPINNKADAQFVQQINSLSKRTGISPERTLYTIETNEISETASNGLRAHLGKYSGKEKQRRERIIRLINTLASPNLKYDEQKQAKTLVARIRSTRGSKRLVEEMIKTFEK
ncbi:MAG: hypothetical protein CL944_02160 [Candidatus Diapherotrites archaeon]|uniref:Uncharacterized protein n=1 Tax=Candidatus Iainarchaeum sp. TaxID=3101447 RepID=A0A2D6LPY9_9ARCH|nr:hypothetical protein [Candidatus Diapherotrites archaeon]|tara:strand:+ start:10268 stop:10876 length:609 start_codon:yes stop_codon:yes gene_type:complete